MRTLVPLITLSIFIFGCQSRPPLVVENSTPIVSAGHTTEALGIETVDGVFTPLIRPGTAIPSSYANVFSTDTDGQSQIMVTPFRGTNEVAAGNHALGRFQIIGIPSAPAGVPKIEVLFTVTDRQILMSARDLTHGIGLEIQRLPGDIKP